MRFRLIVLALAALACLYAVVPDVWAQVIPGQLVTVGCGKVVSCEPLNVTGLNTPTPLPTCPAGQLLVGPGEPGSTCGTPQPTSTPRPTDTPIPADTPRPTDTPAPTETREAQGFSFSTATPATGCIEAAVSIAQIDCVAPGVAITPAPTSTPIPPVSTATPRSTDTPIPPVATATREAQGFSFSTATPATGCIEAAVSTGRIDCVAPSVAITAAPTSTPRATDTPIPTSTPSSGFAACSVTTATPVADTFLEYTGTICEWGTATPRPTDTPIPAPTLVATATPRSTDTPIPAPTAYPTLAVGQLIVGTGGQGVQNGNVNFTTATPVANSFPFCPGGGGTACTYATQVPTATIIATATPRATDTPIPTPTAFATNGSITLWLFNNTTVAGSTTDYFGNMGLCGTTESNCRLAVARATTLRSLTITTSTTQPGSGSLVGTLFLGGSSTACVVTVGINAVAGIVQDTHACVITSQQLMSLQIKNNASATSAAITGVSFTLDN